MSETYDRIATGERLRKRRIQFGLSREEVAERIGKAAKYYADIERGSCGMSVETMIALTKVLQMSLDDIVFGSEKENGKLTESEITYALLCQIDEEQQKDVREIIKLFARACTKGK